MTLFGLWATIAAAAAIGGAFSYLADCWLFSPRIKRVYLKRLTASIFVPMVAALIVELPVYREGLADDYAFAISTALGIGFGGPYLWKAIRNSARQDHEG